MDKFEEKTRLEASISNLKDVHQKLCAQWDRERVAMMVEIEKKGAERSQIATQIQQELAVSEQRLAEIEKELQK